MGYECYGLRAAEPGSTPNLNHWFGIADSLETLEERLDSTNIYPSIIRGQYLSVKMRHVIGSKE